jgi:hypothetical protein
MEITEFGRTRLRFKHPANALDPIVVIAQLGSNRTEVRCTQPEKVPADIDVTDFGMKMD